MWRDMTAVTAKMKEHGGRENLWDLFSVVVDDEQCNFIGNPDIGNPFAWADGLPLCAPILVLTVPRTKNDDPASWPLSAQGNLSSKGVFS